MLKEKRKGQLTWEVWVDCAGKDSYASTCYPTFLIKMFVQILIALLLPRLPADIPGKAADDT